MVFGVLPSPFFHAFWRARSIFICVLCFFARGAREARAPHRPLPAMVVQYELNKITGDSGREWFGHVVYGWRKVLARLLATLLVTRTQTPSLFFSACRVAVFGGRYRGCVTRFVGLERLNLGRNDAVYRDFLLQFEFFLAFFFTCLD